MLVCKKMPIILIVIDKLKKTTKNKKNLVISFLVGHKNILNFQLFVQGFIT